ncbi:MAG: hypothetical protein CVV49_15155 [Spirochaetae bacterium HGW-Spirochaetae-5]|nr:MAG: hypothetical protein CVV49_15155 [Spirochaetae bacterium HGW-Spirochaetae-5]
MQPRLPETLRQSMMPSRHHKLPENRHVCKEMKQSGSAREAREPVNFQRTSTMLHFFNCIIHN